MSTIGHNEPEPNHFKILAAWHRKELKILLWNWCGAWRQAIDKMPLLIPTRAYFCWNIAFSYWSIRLSTACVHHVMVLFELLKACSLHYTIWWSFLEYCFVWVHCRMWTKSTTTTNWLFNGNNHRLYGFSKQVVPATSASLSLWCSYSYLR